MTATQSLNLYNISLRYFKSEADAVQFVKEIEVVVDNKFEVAKDTLSTKEDIYMLKEEVHALTIAMNEDINSIAQKLSDKMADQFKWIIGLFIPLYLSILGLFIAILLKK